MGALAGVGLAYVGVKTFLSLLPVDVPAWMRLQVDFRVLAFAVAAAITTAVAAMLIPASQQLRVNVSDVLKQGARGSTEGHTPVAWIRRALVVGEIALSLVLLTGAGLMIRSFQAAMARGTGLRPDHLLVVESGRYVPNVTGKAAEREYCDVYRRVQVALGQVPGVLSASGGHTIPFLTGGEKRPLAELYTLRRATREKAFRLPFRGADVMPGYFETLGIPILEGRDFTDNDSTGMAPAVVISKRTAETLFGSENAVGQKVRFGINQEYDPWSTVIGVVGSVRFNAGEREAGYEVYWSYRQYPGPGIRFLVRAAGGPSTLVPHIRKVIQEIDPDISVDRTVPMDSLVTESIWRRRLWGAILAVFAGMALLLALVGLYGVMSYLVAQQQKEIVIRLAIGAARHHVIGSVLRRGMVLATAGLVAGIALALPGATLLGDLLFGIPPHDAFNFAVVSVALILTSALACAVPAVRASRTDPMTVLRQIYKWFVALCASMMRRNEYDDEHIAL